MEHHNHHKQQIKCINVTTEFKENFFAEMRRMSVQFLI